MICTPHHILWGDHIKKNEMGEACSKYGENERCIDVDKRLILKWIFKRWHEGEGND